MRPLERSERSNPGLSGLVRPLPLALGLTAAALALALMILGQALPGASESRRSLDRDRARLGQPLTPTERAAIKARTRDTLRRYPLEAGAVSLLGNLQRAQGHTRDADLLFNAAWKLSHRDASADLWLFEKAMGERQFSTAFLHADALMRREPSLRKRLFPSLLFALDDPTAMAPLIERLRLRPGWRRPFFATTFDGPARQRAATLLWALQDSGSQATKDEVEAYLTFLVGEKRYEEAFLAWALFLPSGELPKVGGIFDGDFSGRETFAPFGWRLESDAGGVVAMEPGGGGALQIVLFGPPAPNLARQLLVLTPGRYRLSFRARLLDGRSDGALEWSLICAGDGHVLARLPVSIRGEGWRNLTMPFEIPPAGCSGQMLKLSAPGRGDSTSPRVQFDDLAISESGISQP